MDFWEVVKKRKSVRRFLHEEVPDEAIQEMIKAAVMAPSGSNAKNWHFMVIRTDAVKEKLKQAVENKIADIVSKMASSKAKDEFSSYSKYFTFFSSAPVVIAVIMKKYDSLSMRILKKYDDDSYVSTAGIQNVAASIENMLLAATALGLGACWMTGPLIAKKELEKVLDINSEDSLMAIIPVGAPADMEGNDRDFPEKIEDSVTYL